MRSLGMFYRNAFVLSFFSLAVPTNRHRLVRTATVLLRVTVSSSPVTRSTGRMDPSNDMFIVHDAKTLMIAGRIRK